MPLEMLPSQPKVILIFSGKRKCGKDFVTELLQQRIRHVKCSVLRLSGPLKEQYAKEHNLDFNQLLDATAYKEKYRSDMIRWGEERRNQDFGYFCRLITSGPGSEAPVWIISDARRKTDIKWFLEQYPGLVYTVRIETSEETRKQRGWVFTKGVDDAESECDLDTGVSFDYHIVNNGDKEQLENSLVHLKQVIDDRLKF